MRKKNRKRPELSPAVFLVRQMRKFFHAGGDGEQLLKAVQNVILRRGEQRFTPWSISLRRGDDGERKFFKFLRAILFLFPPACSILKS